MCRENVMTADTRCPRSTAWRFPLTYLRQCGCEWRSRCLVAALLLAHSLLLAYGATVQSPTVNEPAHLVAGISYWQSRSFRLYSVNPPLVRLVATAPVLLCRP